MAKKKTDSDDYFAFAQGGGKAKGSKPPAKKETAKKEPAKKQPAPKKEPAKKQPAKKPEAKAPAKPAKPAVKKVEPAPAPPKKPAIAAAVAPIRKQLNEKQFRNLVAKGGRIKAVVEIELGDLLGDIEHLNDFVDDLIVPEKSIAGLSDLKFKVHGANTKRNAVLLMVDADAKEVLRNLDEPPGLFPPEQPKPPTPPEDDAESDDGDDTPLDTAPSNGEQQPGLFDNSMVESPLEGNGEKLRPDANGRFVPARVKSSDGEVERGFDALPFLRDADEQDVLTVAGHHWGEEESAQRVADFCADQNPQIQEVYDYVESLGPDEGYTVTVDGERAMAWLRQHRTALAFRIKQ